MELTKTKKEKVAGTTPLTPIKTPWVESLINQKAILFDLIDKYGSPINILHPEPFKNNYRDFAQVLNRHNIDFQIYFARKANKCRFFVDVAKELGMGVDTASFNELQQTLLAGQIPARIILTAAIKDSKTLKFAIENQIEIIVDNMDECLAIAAIAEQEKLSVKIGIRLSGFWYQGEKLFSRFGFDVDKALTILEELHYHSDFELLHIQGLHFHLDGYSTDQRASAISQCLDLIEKMNEKGIPCSYIDIGGGFLVNYLESAKQWEEFDLALKHSLFPQNPEITYRNDGLGYQLYDNQIIGRLSTYPYFNTTPRALFLSKILKNNDGQGRPIHERLSKMGIQLRLEPGRAMLDQCGITVARVAHRKFDARGNLLIGLEMNMSQMNSSSADFLLDPVLLYQNENDGEEIDAYFTGAYCLERDIILKRKIRLEKVPDNGDLVVFINTAGYMMHFFETKAHQFDLAQNLIYMPSQGDISCSNFILEA